MDDKKSEIAVGRCSLCGEIIGNHDYHACMQIFHMKIDNLDLDKNYYVDVELCPQCLEKHFPKEELLKNIISVYEEDA